MVLPSAAAAHSGRARAPVASTLGPSLCLLQIGKGKEEEDISSLFKSLTLVSATFTTGEGNDRMERGWETGRALS